MAEQIPLRLLSVFETVIRCGGFHPAARALNVSQAAVSQSIRQLEERLGTRLLNRATRPASLTRTGQILYGATGEALARIGAAIDEIDTLGQAEDPGTVTLACSIGVATYWLMPRLAVVASAMPDVAVNVMTTHQGAPDMAPGVDLAIRYGDGAWRDGRVALLFRERVQPVCSPAYLAAGATPARTLLHVDTEDARWLGWPAYHRRAGLPPHPAKGLRFTNYVQATQAALNGQGVMLGWRSITGDLQAQGRLVAAGPAIEPDDAFYLVQAATSAKGDTIGRVADALHHALGVIAAA